MEGEERFQLTLVMERLSFSLAVGLLLFSSSLFMLVLDRESSSWDEMGICCGNLKNEN